MSCSQTLAGLARDCSPNIGGIKRVLLANTSDVSALTVTTGVVSAITMDTGKKFKAYNFNPQTSSLSSNYTVDQANNIKFVESDLVLVFAKMNTTARLEIAALAQADLYAIVEDNNGTFWLLGYDEPVGISAGDGLTGTQRTDRNGYSITLHDVSKELPMEVSSSIIEGIL